ncbi:MAG: hypothetical protein H0W83_11575, partial [Planctomycetes bacterium]|nr:hypothetical protein [Planctomycetota bacterium]
MFSPDRPASAFRTGTLGLYLSAFSAAERLVGVVDMVVTSATTDRSERIVQVEAQTYGRRFDDPASEDRNPADGAPFRLEFEGPKQPCERLTIVGSLRVATRAAYASIDLYPLGANRDAWLGADGLDGMIRVERTESGFLRLRLSPAAVGVVRTVALFNADGKQLDRFMWNAKDEPPGSQVC